MVYLSIISLGICLVSMFIFLQKTNSQNIKGNKKIKPIIVLEDLNRPSLNYDGTRVAAIPEIGLSEVFDVYTGKLLGSYKVEDSNTAIISPDGKRVRIFDGKNQTTFEVETGKMLSQSKTDVYKDGKFIQYFNVISAGGITYRNYTSDLSIVAAPYPTFTKENKPDQPTILVGNIDNHTLICELYIEDGYVKRDTWSDTLMTPDGKFVASSRFNYNDQTRNRTVVWDVEKRKVIFSLPFSINWLSMSADGKRLVTRDDKEGGKIEIWNVMTGEKISTLTGTIRGQKVQTGNHGVISPDGKLLVTSRAEEIMIWDTETGRFLASQDQSKYSGSLVRSPTFSGDGKRLAVGSDTEVVTVWSVDEILKIENKTLTAE